MQAESKAWIEHTKQGEVFFTENASFDFVHVLQDDGETYIPLLVLHTDRNEWSESRDDVSGFVTVTARTAFATSSRGELWTFRAPGNEGRSLPYLRMFEVSNWPCCSALFENIYFSLLNGEKLYSTNGVPGKGSFGQDSSLVRIDGKHDGDRNSQTRYVGFGAVGDFRKEKPTLQYGTDRTIKQRFSLLGREYADNFDAPKVSVTTDGKQLSSYLQLNGQLTFTIVLQFEDGFEVRIPVENDIVYVDRATLPDGYSLRPDKP